MRLTWPYSKIDRAQYSYGAKWFGLNVEKKDIKAPTGSSRHLESHSHARAPAIKLLINITIEKNRTLCSSRHQCTSSTQQSCFAANPAFMLTRELNKSKR